MLLFALTLENHTKPQAWINPKVQILWLVRVRPHSKYYILLHDIIIYQCADVGIRGICA